MKKLVLDFSKYNPEFKDALKSLQRTYNTNDVSSEVLADISGQLFGNQEFINKLSNSEPSIFRKMYDNLVVLSNRINNTEYEDTFMHELKSRWENAYRNTTNDQVTNNLNDTQYSLSKNALQEVAKVVNQTKEESDKNNLGLVKLKDNTIKTLVDYGIEDLPMLEKSGHVRENVLTEEQAQKLGYSTKNKHYHGLGVKTYLEIIDSMDNPIRVYQYTEKGNYNSNNFIVVTPININGTNYIVPVEINNNPGQYNGVEIDYNKIKTAYAKDSNSYIDNLLKQGKIKEIFVGSNSQETSLTKNNITQSKDNVKLSTKYSMQEDENNTQDNKKWQEYLDKNHKPTGIRTSLPDIKKKIQSNQILTPLEISQLTPEDANTTPMLPKVNRNKTSDGKSSI